eukprot:3292377-Prymnesium_polylepis.2
MPTPCKEGCRSRSSSESYAGRTASWRSISGALSTFRSPLGHSMVTVSTAATAPRPKCATGSCWQR